MCAERERKLETPVPFIPQSHSRLRYHTSLGDHSRTTTEPATPPAVGASARLVPGLGGARRRSAALAAPRARAEVLIGSPRHGRATRLGGAGGAIRVPGTDVPRRTTRRLSRLSPSLFFAPLRSLKELCLSVSLFIANFLRRRATIHLLYLALCLPILFL